MSTEWITDRLPTEADGDGDGGVETPAVPNGKPGNPFERNWQHWSLIVPGQPWWSEKTAIKAAPEPAEQTEPVGRKVVQISSHQGCVLALTDDGLIFSLQEDDTAPDLLWVQLPAIPQPTAGEGV